MMQHGLGLCCIVEMNAVTERVLANKTGTQLQEGN